MSLDMARTGHVSLDKAPMLYRFINFFKVLPDDFMVIPKFCKSGIQTAEAPICKSQIPRDGGGNDFCKTGSVLFPFLPRFAVFSPSGRDAQRFYPLVPGVALWHTSLPLKAVAEAAGVSAGTVSNVIKGAWLSGSLTPVAAIRATTRRALPLRARLLFYRRDLFDDPQLRSSFRKCRRYDFRAPKN